MTQHTEQDAIEAKASAEPSNSPLAVDARLAVNAPLAVGGQIPAHHLPDVSRLLPDARRGNDSVLDYCAGCEALTQRVEQLEQHLAALSSRMVPFPEATVLSTPGCYWLTIGIHCVLFGLMSMGIELLGVLLYPFAMGAVGSLVVCHVLANRSVIHKFSRTLLSAVCICSVITLGLGLISGSSFEILQMQLLFVPPMFCASWFAAKIFVWTRGWMIIPPSNDGVKLPMKIRDIFFVTLVVAVYFGVARAFAGESPLDLDDQESWPVLAIGIVACMLGALAAAMIARGALVPKIRFRWLIGAYLATTLGSLAMVVGFLAFSGELADGSEIVAYLFYGLLGSALVILSPMITFLLMRSARYRFGAYWRPTAIGPRTANA